MGDEGTWQKRWTMFNATGPKSAHRGTYCLCRYDETTDTFEHRASSFMSEISDGVMAT